VKLNKQNFPDKNLIFNPIKAVGSESMNSLEGGGSHASPLEKGLRE